MNLFDKTYQAIDLTNTTTAEAIGIVYAALTEIDESATEDVSEFINITDAFTQLSWNHIDRVPETMYNDNIHRSDGNYCVRLMLETDDIYNYCDNPVSYLISIGSDQELCEPNLEVAFQKVEKFDTGEKVFQTIARVSLKKETIEYLLTDK